MTARAASKTRPRRTAAAAGREAPAAGFTLIEVLVALAILSLAVVACIQGFAQGLRLLKLAGDHQNAMLLADEKMREVVDPKEGRENGMEGLLAWERTIRQLETPDLKPADGTERGRVFEIDVRVAWPEKRQVEIRTLRLVPPPTQTTVSTMPGTITQPGVTPTPSGGTGASPLGSLFGRPK